MSILANIFKSKAELQQLRVKQKERIVEAKHVLAQCDRFEAEYPSIVAQIRGRNGSGNPQHNMLAVRSLHRLKSDVPDIRAHWSKKLKEALAA